MFVGKTLSVEGADMFFSWITQLFEHYSIIDSSKEQFSVIRVFCSMIPILETKLNMKDFFLTHVLN